MTTENAIDILSNANLGGVLRKAADMGIAALREQDVTDINVGDKWISVKDRLPENYKTVLVYRENLSVIGGYMALEYIAPAFGNIPQWSNDLNTYKSKVTHWMPLPEPPKEEKHG